MPHCPTCTCSDHRDFNETQAAKLLRIGRNTLRRWAASGRIPHYRTLDGSPKYPRAVILEMAERLHAMDQVKF